MSQAKPYLRYAAPLLCALLLAKIYLGDAFHPFILVATVVLIALGAAAHQVELHSRRPAKNYLRVALGSAALGLALVAMPLLIGEGVGIGLILWVALAGGALAWAHFYERTEPR